MSHYRRSGISLACALCLGSSLMAQTPPGLLIETARVQIDSLSVDSAATLLLQALDPRRAASTAERTRALVLLGVIELIGSRVDGARRLFREALTLDPGLRVDSLASLHTFLQVTFDAERSILGTTSAPAQARPTTPESTGSSTLPVVRSEPMRTTGRGYTCGLEASEAFSETRAYCWGSNSVLQLGQRFGTRRIETPTPVLGGRSFENVTAGASHTCGLTSTGEAYCWGSNTYGELGNGRTNNSAIPVRVLGNEVFVSLSAGEGHTCALTKTGGVYCWGANSDGQLGRDGIRSSSVPVRADVSRPLAAVTSGGLHTCGLTGSGAAYCWGRNTEGQLGNATTAQSGRPSAVGGELRFFMISAGAAHTCALSLDGTAYCWGLAVTGSIDTSLTPSHISTVPLRVGEKDSVPRFVSVSAGGLHTCGITASAQVYCWGNNAQNQLGTSTPNGWSSTPRVVRGLEAVTVAAGWNHTCAITRRGPAFCWGDNAEGQLGTGNRLTGAVPVPVGGFVLFRSTSPARAQ